MEVTEITVYDTSVERCLEIVRDLRTLGMEFEYRFYQGGYDWEMQETKPYKTVFSFANPADATAFSLRYL